MAYGAAALLAAVLLFMAYSPVMHTQFLFDDTNQQFALPSATEPLSAWIGPVRPVLMFSYWTNVQISREDTFSYHLFNLVIHGFAAMFVFLIIRRLMEWAGGDSRLHNVLAGFGALLFLVHPLQTESVAYIAGRSESLSGMFAVGAIAAFLYRRSAAVSWTGVAAVLLMFGAAVLSKEQSVVVPVVLLLTDFWWNPGFSLKGIFGNWRLYGLMAVGAVAGAALFWSLILGKGTGGSAGFGIKEFTWYQYLFTQFRSLWVYIANFVLPANLDLDWDFPISRTIVDHGAVIGLIGLAGLAAAAWYFRNRFRLAGYGYFLFLVLLLPTSSILPIKDPIADRRMYLPMIGLILIAVDFLGRLKVNRTTLTTLRRDRPGCHRGDLRACDRVERPSEHLGGHRAQIARQEPAAFSIGAGVLRAGACRPRGCRVRKGGCGGAAGLHPAARLGPRLRRPPSTGESDRKIARGGRRRNNAAR